MIVNKVRNVQMNTGIQIKLIFFLKQHFWQEKKLVDSPATYYHLMKKLCLPDLYRLIFYNLFWSPPPSEGNTCLSNASLGLPKI